MGASGEQGHQEKRTHRLTTASPATYHIRLQGGLDEGWSDALAGMKVTVRPDQEGRPVTVLSGRVVDQAMLLGVLNCVYDLGLPLLLVQLIAVEEGEIHEHHERKRCTA